MFLNRIRSQSLPNLPHLKGLDFRIPGIIHIRGHGFSTKSVALSAFFGRGVADRGLSSALGRASLIRFGAFGKAGYCN